MKPKHNLSRDLFLVASSMAVFSAANAHAADITWDSPATIAGDSDVLNVGSLQYGYTESTVGTSVNGVAFAAGNSTTDLGGGNVTMSGFNGGVDTGSYIGSNPLGLSSAYQTLVRGGAWATAAGTATVTLNNLGTGHVYAMQYWVADYRSYPNDRNLTLTGGAVTSGQLLFLDGDFTNGVQGSYVIGRFTADATSQAITVTANESAQLNAIQLRDLTGVWTGTASGNLNNGDANFNGGSYSTISALGTPVTHLHFDDTDGFGNAVTANTLTVDAAGFSADTLNFQNSGVDYTLQNASGSTGITGATAINKSGSGTLTLASANSYTGMTTLDGGTLRLENTAALGSNLRLNMANGTTLQLRADGDATFDGGDGIGGLGGVSIILDVDQLTSGNTGKTLSFATGGFNTYDTTINVTGDNGYTLSLGGINEGFGGPITLNANSANLTIGNIGSSSAVSNLSVGGDSNTEITGSINSSGGLTKSGNGTLTLSGTSSYTGTTTVNAGALEVTAAGSLHFRPTTNGTTNQVTGTATLSFLGTVDLDLGAADLTNGNAWTLFDVGGFSSHTLAPAAITSTAGSFGKSGTTWTLTAGANTWTFEESTGVLSLAIAAANDYVTWGSTYGLTAGSEGGDLDNDGLTNQEEYAFGLIPNSGSSINAFAVPFNKATGTFSYTRRTVSLQNPLLTYSVWYSTDLATWTQDLGASQSVTGTASDVDTVEVTLTPALLTNPKLFIQVRAQ